MKSDDIDPVRAYGMDLDRQYDRLLHEVVGAMRWMYDISPSGEVLAARYGDQIVRFLGENPEKMDWVKSIHPDDRERVKANFLAALHDPEGKLPYDSSFRILRGNGTVRWIRSFGRITIRKDGSRELVGLSMDITDTVEEQRKRLLGAVPISPDVLAKANIGLWAFELDEGQPPRMYHDETMLGLVGLDHQLPPEEAYHAWYDHVDPDCYQLVNDAVAKMMAGEHAEVQYPWHHPDGHTMIVRCGGVRNFSYKKGIRVEGTHQNVSEVLHYDDAEVKRLKAREQELMHAEFRASAVAYLSEHEGDVKSFLNFFAERLRKLINCDQVIYRGAKGEVVISNAPELGDDFKIDQALCKVCPRFNMHSPIYKEGVVEIADMAKCQDDTRAPEGCPVKASLVRIVNLDGKANSFLTIHYIRECHEFTDNERKTLEEFANLLSLSLSRFEAQEKNAELQRELKLKQQIAVQKEQLEKQRHELQKALDGAVAGNVRFGVVKRAINAIQWSASVNANDEVVAMHHDADTSEFLNIDLSEIPHDWEKIVHPDDREAAVAAFNAAIRDHSGRTPYDVTYRMIDRDGNYRWYRSAGTVIRNADGSGDFIGIHINVTEEHEARYRYERELSESAKVAQQANAAKTKFFFSMSHDIRTPMNAIKGFTEIAKKNLDDREKLADCLSKIGSSEELLLTLINSVLDMSRVEAGKAKIEETPGDVMQSFANIEPTLQTLAKSRDVRLSFEFGDIRDRYIYADFEKTNRVFVNLVSNGIKYSKPNGYVKVRCEQIEECEKVRVKGEKVWYRYTFSDNGIGMGEEFQKHAFDEFTREHSTTASGVQGTGLGLSLCKSFIELMGGTISCISKQGEGTTFIVELPFRVQEEGKSKGEKVKSVDGKDLKDDNSSLFHLSPLLFTSKRILLVEDNELNREVAEYTLKEQGFKVESAEDGQVAVDLVKEKGLDYYDCILMDIQMPIMGGYEATRAIREWEREKGRVQSAELKVKDDKNSSTLHSSLLPLHLPIIALSANAFAEDKAASIAAGMDDHIAKPIKINELLSVLSKHLQ